MLTDLRGNKLKAACQELIEAGLWRAAPGGYQFHDWDQYQPMRADVEQRREADRNRKSVARVRKDSERNPRGRNSESDSPVPSRPVQTPKPPPFDAVMRDLQRKVADDDETKTIVELPSRSLTTHEQHVLRDIVRDIDQRSADARKNLEQNDE
jgi:hypothetical protein